MDSKTKSIKKLYYSIGEVSKITELKPYVLRYWETEFKELRPSKNNAGNRTYRQKDIDLILRIKDLLYNQKFTIEGARKRLTEPEPVNVEPSESSLLENESNAELLTNIRRELKSILEELNK